MSSAKFDPVEAAKIRAPASKKQTPAASSSPPPAEAAPAPTPPAPAPPASVPPSPARDLGQAGFSAGYRRYRVAKTKSFSWAGNMTQLQAGAVVEPGSYGGAPGLERLAAQGVELVPID